MDQKRCYGCMQPRTDGRFCESCGYEFDRPNASFQLPTGCVLKDQYLVGKALDQDGMSITYLGWDLYLNIPVAIKEFYPVDAVMRDNSRSLALNRREGGTGSGFEKNRQRFLREAQSLSQLSDVPEVVRIRNFFPENESAYIIMEYVNGKSLRNFVTEQGCMTAEQALKMLMPVMEGLKKVHDAGILHRGISPDSIMILPDGRIKIVDFGAVWETEENLENVSTQIILNPAFAPIEQYNRKGNLGPWTDVYSLCSTMYFCMTGMYPRSAADRSLDQRGIGWERVPGLSTRLIHVLNQATQIHPENRLQDMQALMNNINGAFTPAPAEEPIRYVPPVVNNHVNTAPNFYPQPQQPQKKKNKVIPVLIGVALVILALVICYFTVHIWEDATCTEPQTCSICGKTDGDALGHNWSKATCTDPKICKECGDTEGSAKGHNWEEATCITPKTCSECGETKGSVQDHQWQAATCTTPETCATCGKTEGTANGHQWKNATCTEAKTCSVCKKTDGSALGHSWKAATYNTPKTCSRCGKTEGKALGYLESVSGYSESVHLGNCNTHALVFDTPLKNCSGFTLNFKVTFNSNVYVGQWKMYYRDNTGKWKHYGNFSLDGNSASVPFKFNPKLNIEAVAVIPVNNGGYSWSQSLWITYAYIG